MRHKHTAVFKSV